MRNCTIVLALFGALVVAMFADTARAATYKWIGITSGTGSGDANKWSVQTNWDIGDGTPGNDGYPNAVDDVADLAIDRTGFLAMRLTENVTIGEIKCGDINTTGFSVMEVYYDSFTFDVSSGSAKITKDAGSGGLDHVSNWSGNILTLNDDLIVENNATGSGSAVTLKGDNMTGSGGITKTGAGYLIMGMEHLSLGNTVNTYTGDTKVDGGTMRLESRWALAATSLNVSGAGTVEFGVGGTVTYELGGLKGQGSIDAGANTLQVKSLSPGNSVGELTVESTLDISPIVDDGSLLFELGADTTAGTTYDHVSMAGDALNIGTLNFADFTFSAETGFGGGIYTLFDAASITGSLGTTDGMIDGLESTLSISDNDVLLTVTAASSTGVIPEPSTLAIWALGLLALGLYARRRR